MSVQNGYTPRLRNLVRWLLASRLRRGVSATVAIIGSFMAISGSINVVTGGWWFETLFPWTEGSNAPPEIVRVFARERGEEIEPAVQSGGIIFLSVIAEDPEGDPILYEWATAEGIFRINELSDPLSPLVLYEPLVQPGVYPVRIRVRDEVHDDFDEATIDVIVLSAGLETLTPAGELEPIHPLDGLPFATLPNEEVSFDWTATTPPYTFSLTLVDESKVVEERVDLMGDSLQIVLSPGEYLWSVSDSDGNFFSATFTYKVVLPRPLPP